MKPGESRRGPRAAMGAFSMIARSNRTLPRERTTLAAWFWEIDRLLLALILSLVCIGLIAIAAASPVAAIDRSTSDVTVAPLYYLYRQIMWVVVSLPLMLIVSMCPATQVRRGALFMTGFFAVMLVLLPVIGTNINGATRWIGSGAFRFQPSEFLKPAFVVTLAWLLSLRAKDPTLPVIPLTGLMTAIVAVLLMQQPDFGQSVIYVAIWMALLVIAGISIQWIGAMVASGLGLIVLAYMFYDNGRQRINTFLGLNQDAAGGPTQVDLAHNTITNGGFIGVGPGGGQAKFHLPEAHTDYIFSVIGEEFGLIACIAIAFVYLAIIVRVFVRLLDEHDPFIILAAGGLTVQLGLQALINMGVNAQLFPSKGMTLPFISYGGSSMIALSIGVGMLLALTRRNPFLARTPYVKRSAG